MCLFNETNASPLNKQGNFRIPYAVNTQCSHGHLLIYLRIQGWFKGLLQPPNSYVIVIFFGKLHFKSYVYLFIYLNFKKGKLHIWSQFYIPYFNLVFNLSIVSIQSLIFQYHINLLLIIIFWMKIDDAFNSQSKKLAFVDVTIHYNVILAV